MFDTVYATQFVRPMANGKTKPNLIECERADGSVVEAVIKCSAMTMQGTKDLAIEAVCGMLAHDLGLPIPEFFAVEVSEEFAALMTNQSLRDMFNRSDRYAFGSLALPSGFNVWGKEQQVPDSLCEVAAEIFTFDGIVINGDRRPENPNCLFSGTEVAIIDHELCFGIELFWVEPWLPGGFATRASPQSHIFAKPRLTRRPSSLARFENAWSIVTSSRVDEYLHALPQSWRLDGDDEARIKRLLLDAKANIHAIVQQSLGVLR